MGCQGSKDQRDQRVLGTFHSTRPGPSSWARPWVCGLSWLSAAPQPLHISHHPARLRHIPSSLSSSSESYRIYGDMNDCVITGLSSPKPPGVQITGPGYFRPQSCCA